MLAGLLAGVPGQQGISCSTSQLHHRPFDVAPPASQAAAEGAGGAAVYDAARILRETSKPRQAGKAMKEWVDAALVRRDQAALTALARLSTVNLGAPAP